MIDYHTHSIYSDGKSTYEDIVNAAIAKGLTEVGLSDHLCIHFPNWAVKEGNFSNLISDIQNLKEKNDLPIKIKFGLEVDYIEGKENEIKNLICLFPVDYIIGSVHYVEDWNFDTNLLDFKTADIDSFYHNYFRLVQQASRSRLFDIIGHADLAKKFNYYPSFNLEKYYENTAMVFSKTDMVVELNTSGKDKLCNEFYPSNQFIKYCFEYNVPFTLGSDSHSHNEIARYYEEALNKLKEIGYRKLAVFNKRKRSYLTI